MIRRICATIVMLCAALGGTVGHAQPYKLTAKLDTERAFVGQPLVYSLSIAYSGNQPQQQPTLPTLDPAWGLGPMKLAGTSNFTQINNGNVVMSVELKYTLPTSKEGTFKIPPASLTVGGQRYDSNEVSLTVTKVTAATVNLPPELQGKVVPPQINPPNAELQKNLTGIIFVLPVMGSIAPYEGQQVSATFYLCIDPSGLEKYGIQGNNVYIRDISLPKFQQFLKEETYSVPQNLTFTERAIGSKKYLVTELYEAAVTPTKTGPLTIEPCGIALSLAAKGRGRSAFDDPFFQNDPLFESLMPGFGGNRLEIVAQSPALEINVKPLPKDGRPAGFAGAVGDFSLTATVDKRTAAAQEDILKLQLKLEGRGNASGISEPKLPDVDGLQLLEAPKSATDRRREGNSTLFSKTFDYILRPMKAGAMTIPPVEIAAFSPTSGRYYKVQSQPVSLQIAPPTNPQAALVANASPAQAVATPKPNGDQPRQLNDDIRYITAESLQAFEPGLLTGEGPLFPALVAVPPALVLAGWLVRRRRNNRDVNRAGYKAKVAADKARKHLRKAGANLDPAKHDAFYEELARGIRGYFGDKLRLDPASLTIEYIDDILGHRGVDEVSRRRIAETLEKCDSARYSPSRPSAEEMKAILDSTAGILAAMEKVLSK
ncbi:MAG: BatD family protein [Candidatus Sumerlaeaceae bacterium]|nr:BatD family protein [Candidatus Sumerlaeaceae bacterium]